VNNQRSSQSREWRAGSGTDGLLTPKKARVSPFLNDKCVKGFRQDFTNPNPTINAMPILEKNESRAPSAAARFDTTHWSVVLLARRSEVPQAKEALENLCRTYWYPLYAFVRRQGHSSHDAQDLTQEFFARLLEKDSLRFADVERGRFRSFLLKSLHHFLVNEWERGRAQKRGGGREIFSLDEEAAEQNYLQEPAAPSASESLYDRRWAVTVLERAMTRLGADYAKAGKEELFETLKNLLLTEGSREAYRGLAGPLGLSEGAVKVALHRLRQRFREKVRTEIAKTVASPDEVDEELRCLLAALSG
jgi:RNA polymerase sigma factor (sigma-70 family)